MVTKTPNERLESAVNSVGAAIDKLMKVLETNTEYLEEEDIQKSFRFLSQTLDSAAEQAAKDRLLAIARKGGFSLSLDVPEKKPAIVPRPPSAQPTRASAPDVQGRPVKESDPDEMRAPILSSSTAVEVIKDDVGFLDED